MAIVDERIIELSRAARNLLAGPTEFLRTFIGDEAEGRRQRRAIIVATLREYEALGNVGISLDELSADVEAVLRLRDDPLPEDLRTECADILRQMEAWDVVDSAIAPERARMDGGLRRRVERDYSLARPMRVFLPHWDDVQRSLRRRYVSLSADYFAQAAAALDIVLQELRESQPDTLRCYTFWQTARQSLHSINRESRDFARELRSLHVDPKHPEALAEVADRLGILYDKFYRVAHEGAALVRQRIIQLKDDPHEGRNLQHLKLTLRLREEEWSVGLGERDEERQERMETIGADVTRDMHIFERLVQDVGPGSWREGVRAISLALVELTERIHAAIALRLQQTQAIEALTRHARMLADGGEPEVTSTRRWLWNASGAFHAAMWVQPYPSTDEQIVLERWLENKGGSPLPMVDDETWFRSFQPRKRSAPPPPPPALITAEDWDAGDDPKVRMMESARLALVERLIAAGSAANLQTLADFADLRILVQLLWLPRDSSPLRRLGIKINPPAAKGVARATIHGPGFDLDIDNYRFAAISNKAEVAPSLEQKAEHLVAVTAGEPSPRQSRTPRTIPDVAANQIVPTVNGSGADAVPAPASPTTPPAESPANRRAWPFNSGFAARRNTGSSPLQKPQE